MYRNFEEIIKFAKTRGSQKVCIVFPEDRDILRTVVEGKRDGLIEPILIGRRSLIEKLALENRFSLDGIMILDHKDPRFASELGIEMAGRGEVSFVIKGNILTTHLYKAILRFLKRFEGEFASTLCFHQISGIEKIFIVTDSGVNIHPDLGTKKGILRNAVRVMNCLGWERPRVMILASPHLLGDRSLYEGDAIELRRLALEGRLGECEVLDSRNLYELISEKRICEEVIPDIFLVPNIEAGNILVKSIDHLGIGIRQCVTVGGGIFLLTPSRSDEYETRMVNLSLGIVLSTSWRSS
jgi:phosphate butyryltransferase